jgi:hydrogenase maturation factor HypF (carbamoyltransferase family)
MIVASESPCLRYGDGARRVFPIGNHQEGERVRVRNRHDGRVEAMLEGEEESVNQVIAFYRQGPPRAWVSKVEIKWEKYRGIFDDFRMR